VTGNLQSVIVAENAHVLRGANITKDYETQFAQNHTNLLVTSHCEENPFVTQRD